jgi:hypothetical protein
MSYSFVVKAEGGQLTVTSDSPQYIPDGQYYISGHEAPPGALSTISISHSDVGGYRLQAMGGGITQAPAQAPEPEPALAAAEPAPAEQPAEV